MQGRVLPGFAGYLHRKAAMHPSGCALWRSQLPLQGSLPGGRRPKCAAAGVNARPTMRGTRAVEEGRQAAARFGGTMRALPPAGGVSERSRYEVPALSAEIVPREAQGRILPGFAGYLRRKAAMHPSGCALRRIQLPLQGSLPGGRPPQGSAGRCEHCRPQAAFWSAAGTKCRLLARRSPPAKRRAGLCRALQDISAARRQCTPQAAPCGASSSPCSGAFLSGSCP